MNEYITRERANELYPIIQAYANGATIQFLSRQQKEDGEWIDVWYDCLEFAKELTFSNNVKYRIKPTDDDINYAKELIRELLLADTRIDSSWNGYLLDLKERAEKFINVSDLKE